MFVHVPSRIPRLPHPRSISWGQGVSMRGVTDWFSVMAKWMVTADMRPSMRVE